MTYSFILHTPKSKITLPFSLYDKAGTATAGGVDVTLKTSAVAENITLYELTAHGAGKCFFSLYGKGDGKLFSFNDVCTEEHVFRQSPHDPELYLFAMDGSAVPMIAAVSGGATDIFISDEPSHCDNYTTQHIIPERGEFYLSSGDPGGAPNYTKWREDTRETKNEPYYHDISAKPHVYRFIAVKSAAETAKGIRRDAFCAIEKTWGTGSDSIYRAMCFGANYMHIRKNETKTSEKWVVAGIQYANTQYDRDSFWQTMILSPEIERQSYLAHTENSVKCAENALFYVIWSYRVFKNGGEVNRPLLEFALAKIESGLNVVGDGRYCPPGNPDGSFRNWFDICCFEKDDADAYSQGLCVCALRAAKELGYDVGDRYEKARAYYRAMFNGKFVPLSMKKQYFALDYSIG